MVCFLKTRKSCDLDSKFGWVKLKKKINILQKEIKKTEFKRKNIKS
jgi:hypothetical protein